MDYIEVAEARELSGLRLVLSRGVPGPFGMAARAILDLRSVPYVAVAQYPAQRNEELVDWTRHRNAPIAMYEDEAPRTGWLEILNLAERLGRGASLVPADIQQRMQMVGLVNEIAGENGFAWHARIMLLGLAGPEQAAEAAKTNPMFAQYGYSAPAADAALPKLQTVIGVLTDQLRSQLDAGSEFLIGSSVTAADIHWAYFSQLVEPFPPEVCPMPEGLRRSYATCGEMLGELDPILLEHRRRMFELYPSLPMDF